MGGSPSTGFLLGGGAVGCAGEVGAGFAEEEEGAADEDGAGAFGKALFGEPEGFGECGGEGAGRRAGGGDEGLRIGRREDAEGVDGREDPFSDDGGEEGDVFFDGFVRRGGEDAGGLAAAEGGAPCVEEGVHGVRVVCAVHDDAGADFFEAAGPLDVVESFGNVALFDEESGEFGKGGDGHAGVFELVGAGEVAGVGDGFFAVVDACVHGGAGFIDGAAAFGLLYRGDDGAVPGDDSGFFAADGIEGAAEVLGVVDADGGDDGYVFGDGVGGVEPAAHACFEDDEVCFVFGEVEECYGEDDFKEGGRSIPVFDVFADAGDVAVEVCGGDHFAADADAFTDVDEVRGGEEACAVACNARDAFDHGAGGAFAVGSGDVDDGGFRIEDAKFLQEAGDAFQSEFDAEVLDAVEPVEGCFPRVHGRGGRGRRVQ